MPQTVQQYVVGGAVRDVLLNIAPKDIDFCWVGTTSEDMIARGFKPVGAAFPVFLDHLGREHALARREKKVAAGYHGFDCQFDPDVTIEEDLLRRDLTINSLAVKYEHWNDFVDTANKQYVIDLYGGIKDLQAGELLHTSEAFKDDPIRLLRTARFAARYNFEVHPCTIQLMNDVLPELSTVPQERIWAEFQKGLMEKHPAKMFEVLRQCGSLNNDGPLRPYGGFNLDSLKRIEEVHDICVRFTLVSGNFTKDDYDICRIPTDCARVARAFRNNLDNLLMYMDLSTYGKLQLLENLRAISDDWLLNELMHVLRCVASRETFNGKLVTQVEFTITEDLIVVRGVDCAAIAATCSNGQEIKQKIFDARIRAMNRE